MYLETHEVYELAQQIHLNQRTKKGKRYFGHLWKVAEGAKTIWQKENGQYSGINLDHVTQAAFLHDSIEDQVSWEYLKEAKVHPDVIDAVILLTKQPGQEYTQYLVALKVNQIANIVKRADLEHNSKLSRLTVGDSLDKLLAKHLKYAKAYLYLSGVIDVSLI